MKGFYIDSVVILIFTVNLSRFQCFNASKTMTTHLSDGQCLKLIFPIFVVKAYRPWAWVWPRCIDYPGIVSPASVTTPSPLTTATDTASYSLMKHLYFDVLFNWLLLMFYCWKLLIIQIIYVWFLSIEQSCLIYRQVIRTPCGKWSSFCCHGIFLLWHHGDGHLISQITFSRFFSVKDLPVDNLPKLVAILL